MNLGKSVTSTQSKSATFVGAGCAVGFWLFWTSIVGVFDLVLSYQLVQQLRTYSFVPVEAVLEECRIEVNSDGEGTSYEPKVRYRYEVAGQQYTSDRLRFTAMAFGESSARAMLPATPVGGKLSAFYNPAAPSTAVLKPGFYLIDLVVPIFLLPFNALSIVGAFVFGDFFRSRWSGHNSLGFRKREFGTETQLRFYSFSPLIAAVVAAGAAGFVVTFPLVIIPSGWVAAELRVLIALIVIAAVVVYGCRRALSSYNELTIDLIRGELTYTPADRSVLPRNISLEKLPQLRIKEKVTIDSDGDKLEKYRLLLRMPEGDSVPIQEYMDRGTAERMARWLSGHGLKLELNES